VLLFRNLKLFGVFSGKELYTKLKNGHEYYNVVIGYLCTDFEGEIKPDQKEVLEARFFNMGNLPANIDPFIKANMNEFFGKITKQLNITL